ncbi:M20 family metallo-hydrolase [Segnochrobactrum spirostomi]|uniref:M20 family metallo-hydrolase n=1 Tax=Segnochrobactrum spirostomi TaxID=2608987 RepID=A0A6A7Y508_9HYPH|nr:M20 family metallo-hydrolase [Segnochrobactrum spirostomi]MQT14254.1 M20 family metallo-hydrolase [Segnochrobactrum spirostomi]
MQNLQINPQRLWDMLMETAAFGGTPKGGVCRLTLTDLDAKVRDWFKAECEKVGCTVRIDEVGNMFALRPGRRNDLPPIAMGSHLDTQPTGGKFDGILGVLGGLEVLKTLHDLGYETNAPVMLVNWTNEEGSRFAPAMLGSGVFAGVFDRAYADSREDRNGVSFKDAIEAIGYRGEVPAGAVELGAMFELHIEQGPILEAEGKTVGIVKGVQGMRWYEATVIGKEAHTGSTPMNLRRDALVGTAKLIEAVNAVALAHPGAVGTVGLIESKPNSRNVIPGEVFFTIDFRHPEAPVLDVLEADFAAAVAKIAEATGLEITWKRIWDSPPVAFHPDLIEAVREGAAVAGLPAREIVSGPGHDAAYIARVCPTTMIFVPSKDGISHNEAESTTFDECGAGAQVLLNAVLTYDRRFAA